MIGLSSGIDRIFNIFWSTRLKLIEKTSISRRYLINRMVSTIISITTVYKISNKKSGVFGSEMPIYIYNLYFLIMILVKISYMVTFGVSNQRFFPSLSLRSHIYARLTRVTWSFSRSVSEF